jgi:hypothetical protein
MFSQIFFFCLNSITLAEVEIYFDPSVSKIPRIARSPAQFQLKAFSLGSSKTLFRLSKDLNAERGKMLTITKIRLSKL